jgi:transposase-like protein
MEQSLPGREERTLSAETEGARRATGVSAGGDTDAGVEAHDPEVPAKARRRQFSPEYRLRILKEADACKDPGQLGALLRREGMYSSNLVTWRRQRDARALVGMKEQKRGPKPRREDPRLKQKDREIARLQRRLKQAETVIEVQKKVAEILGIPLNSPALDEDD